MNQHCDQHRRYAPGCEPCLAARRRYHADLQERRGVPVRPRRQEARHDPPAPGSWAERGLCVGWEADLFFTEATYRLAKTVCAECPVRLLCLEHALTVRENWGIWGGLDPDERRRLRRRQQRKVSA